MWLILLVIVACCLVPVVWLVRNRRRHRRSAKPASTESVPLTRHEATFETDWTSLVERLSACEEVVRAFATADLPPAGAFQAMRDGLARFAGDDAGDAPRADRDNAAYWQGVLKAGIARLMQDLSGEGVLRALGAADAARCVEQARAPAEGAQERTSDVEERAARLCDRVAEATAGVDEVRQRLGVLQKDAANLETRLASLRGLLERAASRPALDRFRDRRDTLARLRDALANEVLPLLEHAARAGGCEASRYYQDALESAARHLDRGLVRADASVEEAEEDGLASDDAERLVRLRARVERMHASGWRHGEQQAQPLVQQYLRPLVDALLRDFVVPLLLEARGDRRLQQAADAVRSVLSRHGLEVIEPPAGARIVPDPEGSDAPYVLASECEEVETLPSGPQAPPETIAALVEPGCRWEGEVIARARVRSYR